MADPTATITRNYKTDANRVEYLIKSGELLVVGAYAALNKTTGLIENGGNSADFYSVGVMIGAANGDNTVLTGDGTTVKGVCRSGIIVTDVSVVGASALTDNGDLVYCTDGQTLTKTPGAGLPVGYIVNWKSGTTCDVYLFTVQEQIGFELPV